MKHLGIYSGTFDPIHEGHVLFAHTALEQLGLDQVLFMPEPKPRHKEIVTDLATREAMVQAALNDHEMSMKLLKTTNTEVHTLHDTVQTLVDLYPDAQFTLLMGADVFEHIGSWPGYQDIAGNLGLFVGLLEEDDGEIVLPLAKQLELTPTFVPVPLSSIRSSRIRKAVANNVAPKGLHDAVAEYIRHYKLYRH